MRRQLCIAAGLGALLITAGNARAQDVSWGVKGGLVFGALDTSGPGRFDTSSDAGGVFGGFVGVGLGRYVRVQPELYWSVRRFATTDAATPFAVSARGVEIPLLLQARFPDARAARVLVFGGPQFGFIGKVTQHVGAVSTDIGREIKDRDLAIVLGAGVERALTSGALVIDLRAVLGGRNLNEGGVGVLKSRAFTLLAGYRF